MCRGGAEEERKKRNKGKIRRKEKGKKNEREEAWRMKIEW